MGKLNGENEADDPSRVVDGCAVVALLMTLNPGKRPLHPRECLRHYFAHIKCLLPCPHLTEAGATTICHKTTVFGLIHESPIAPVSKTTVPRRRMTSYASNSVAC